MNLSKHCRLRSGDRETSAQFHGDEDRTHYHQVLGRRCFPFEILPALKELNIGGVAMQGYGCRGGSAQLFGLIAMEMARFDSSIATFFGVHNGLAMGSIYRGGSEEQKQKWLPPMARWEKIGCFGLTEPLVGSGTSGGMLTT